MKRTLAVIVGLVLLASCGESAGVGGATGQWSKGKALSVNVVFTNMGPLIKLRNDSSRDVPIVPIRVIGWFKTAGKLSAEHVFGVFDRNSPLVSAEFGVTGADGGTRTARFDAVHQNLNLRAGESVTLSSALWSFKAEPFDQMEQVRIAIGQDRSPDQEVFTVK